MPSIQKRKAQGLCLILPTYNLLTIQGPYKESHRLQHLKLTILSIHHQPKGPFLTLPTWVGSDTASMAWTDQSALEGHPAMLNEFRMVLGSEVTALSIPFLPLIECLLRMFHLKAAQMPTSETFYLKNHSTQAENVLWWQTINNLQQKFLLNLGELWWILIFVITWP